MSANPVVNEPVEINSVPEAEPGGTYTGSGSYGVFQNSYNVSGLFSGDSKLRIPPGARGIENFATFRNRTQAIFANTNQGVFLRNNSRATWGIRNGKPIEIGGAVLDASKARRVVVTLGADSVNNASKAVVPRRFIPDDVRATIRPGRVNTVSVLSRGADQYTGTSARDLVSLGRGNDRAILGKGNDLVVMNTRINSKRIGLGPGRDRLLLEDGALKRPGKVRLDDFNARKDTVLLETRASKVSGFGSDTLRISTKNGAVRLVSDGDKFSRSSIEFVL
jgi:hypothetical protein